MSGNERNEKALDLVRVLWISVRDSSYEQKAAAVDTDEGLPRGKNKNKNQLTGRSKIFTSTVYNLIYKYILGIN